MKKSLLARFIFAPSRIVVGLSSASAISSAQVARISLPRMIDVSKIVFCSALLLFPSVASAEVIGLPVGFNVSGLFSDFLAFVVPVMPILVILVAGSLFVAVLKRGRR